MIRDQTPASVVGMCSRARRSAGAVAAAVGIAAAIVPLAAQPAGFEIAFYNIRSGKGMQPLRGRPAPFAESDFCTGADRPMNAWGAGFVQKELAASIAADPDIIALGEGTRNPAVLEVGQRSVIERRSFQWSRWRWRLP